MAVMTAGFDLHAFAYNRTSGTGMSYRICSIAYDVELATGRLAKFII